MARFYGKVGYGTPTDKGNGVWEDVVVEHSYYGDVEQNFRKFESGDTQVNPDLFVSNIITIVADQYAIDHFHRMKYIEWEGVRWIINTVEVRRPRLKLWLGKVYNGPTPQI